MSQKSDANQSIIKRSQPVYTTVRRYNHKLNSRLHTTKLETTVYKDQWTSVLSQIEAGKLDSATSESKKVYFLKLIEMFYEQNLLAKELISLKNLVNNNGGKLEVLRSLLGQTKSAPEISNEEHAHQQEQIEGIEDLIREAEEQSFGLDSELRSLNSKTANLEKEIKKTSEGSQGRNIDEEIRVAERKIRVLEEML